MTIDYAMPTVRVSEWRVKDRPGERSDHPALPDLAQRFNRLMRPPRYAGDLRPSLTSARTALLILANAMAPDTAVPSLVPCFDGGLQIEWHMNGVDLEIWVGPEGDVSAWCEHSSGREWEDEGDLNMVRLQKELSQLVSHG